MVEGVLVKSREEVISETVSKYPPENFPDWYKTNMPDVYAGYMIALNKFKPAGPVTVKEKAKVSLKLFLIILGVLAGFAVIVYFVFINFLNQGLSAVLG